ncbi:MAG: helix-turn-helix domain-containing protein [Vulcanimicrobiaceae bacterium]
MKNFERPAPALLGFDAAQHYLGNISRSTLKLLKARGEIVAVNVNRRVLFPRAGLDAFIARQVEAATPGEDRA